MVLASGATYRYVYGPVPSRRLGRSLGVNPIPRKVCSFNCVYCQLGRTRGLTATRRDYFPPGDIDAEIREALARPRDDVDFMTFVGEGEPTLCRSLGRLIRTAKGAGSPPIAVITNGSLLHHADVRRDLGEADVVVPSLDAVDPSLFRRINRPHGSLRIEELVEGLTTFRDGFAGEIWIEVMLVRGMNDTDDALEGLRRTLDRVRPDRVFVNVPIRPPAESWVRIPEVGTLIRARELLGDAIGLEGAEQGDFGASGGDDPVDALLAIARRHPMRRGQVLETLARLAPDESEALFCRFAALDGVLAIEYRGETYYSVRE